MSPNGLQGIIGIFKFILTTFIRPLPNCKSWVFEASTCATPLIISPVGGKMEVMNNTKIIVALIGSIVIIIAGWIGISSYYERKAIENISNFEQCAASGFPVMESHPRQCRAGDKTFTEEIKPVVYDDKVKVTMPLINAFVDSPLQVIGEARGPWYFEAAFPIRLLDGNGNEITKTQGRATAEWTTENYVPFEAVLIFTPPSTETGTLVLEKDNPSGLPQNAESFKIPVRFKIVVPSAEEGIEGAVTIGPACPVEKFPPDPNCANKPYKASLEAVTKDGKTAKRFSSGDDGKFKVSLPSGEYVVKSDSSSSILPRMAPVNAVVETGKFTRIDIGFDSGIR